MSLSWNAFSPLLIIIDAMVLASAWYTVRWQLQLRNGGPVLSTLATGKALLRAGVLTLLPWVLASVAWGGILGMCLLSRSLWVLATVAVPLLAFWLYRRWQARWLWVLIVLPLSFKVWGEVLEPAWLDVEYVKIPIVGLTRPVKIVHLSDLQTDGIRPMEIRAREAANAFDADLLLFTGDILNHPELEQEVGDYLRGFTSKHGGYFVSGNVDAPGWSERFIGATPFRFLDGKTAMVETQGGAISIVGLGMEHVARSDMLRAGKDDKVAVRIAISHYPDAIFAAAGSGIEVVFAGHTHGGQVSTPFGPPVTLSHVPRTIAAGGLHRYKDLWVSVSRGLGWEGHIAPRVRLFSRPHLILMTLEPA